MTIKDEKWIQLYGTLYLSTRHVTSLNKIHRVGTYTHPMGMVEIDLWPGDEMRLETVIGGQTFRRSMREIPIYSDRQISNLARKFLLEKRLQVT